MDTNRKYPFASCAGHIGRYSQVGDVRGDSWGFFTCNLIIEQRKTYLLEAFKKKFRQKVDHSIFGGHNLVPTKVGLGIRFRVIGVDNSSLPYRKTKHRYHSPTMAELPSFE